MIRKLQFRDGFTLLELLVVISIISILVAIITINFQDARESARDKIRQSDLKQLQLAIELYKSQNGRYPEACNGQVQPNYRGVMPAFGGCAEYIVGLTPDYISELPVDEAVESANHGFVYTTDSTGSAYKLMLFASVEREFVESYTNEFAACPYECTGGGETGFCDSTVEPNVYAVYSAGAECW